MAAFAARIIIIKTLLPIISFILFFAPNIGHSGCPAFPPVKVKAHINSCKVYSFKNDEAYRSLYRESIDKLPKNEIESFERRVITNLTGLVLDVDIIQQDPAKNFQFKDVKKIFYRTTETEFCEHDKDSKYFLTINSSCAMFRFDIPQGIRWHVVDTPESLLIRKQPRHPPPRQTSRKVQQQR